MRRPENFGLIDDYRSHYFKGKQMANNLEFHGLKDTWADNCDACGRVHRRTIQIEGYGDFTGRSQCEGCNKFEDRLGRLNLLIGKTRRTLDTTKDNPKNSEVRAKLAKLEQDQLKLRNNIIEEAKRFLAGRRQQEQKGSDLRLPYKEN